MACNGPEPTDGTFAGIPYDSAVAYAYNGEGAREIVDEKGVLSDRIAQSTTMDKKQINALREILFSPSTYGGPIAACFEPHLGFVFYRAGKPAAHVSICFDCNYLVSSFPVPKEDGFSDNGAKALAAFEKELGF